MDVERTIEFILQCQAKTEALLTAAAERQDGFEKRQDRLDRRVDRLARYGMRIMDTSQRRIDDFSAGMAELRASQALTDQALCSFIENLQKGRNGH